eukprot:tig00020961_g16638.t1
MADLSRFFKRPRVDAESPLDVLPDPLLDKILRYVASSCNPWQRWACTAVCRRFRRLAQCAPWERLEILAENVRDQTLLSDTHTKSATDIMNELTTRISSRSLDMSCLKEIDIDVSAAGLQNEEKRKAAEAAAGLLAAVSMEAALTGVSLRFGEWSSASFGERECFQSLVALAGTRTAASLASFSVTASPYSPPVSRGLPPRRSADRLLALLKRFSSLRSLGLPFQLPVTPEEAGSLVSAQLRSLRALHLALPGPAAAETLQRIAALPLEELSLFLSGGETNGLATLAGPGSRCLETLRRLAIDAGHPLPAGELAALAQLPSLRSLCLSVMGEQAGAQVSAVLSGAPQLRELCLNVRVSPVRSTSVSEGAAPGASPAAVARALGAAPDALRRLEALDVAVYGYCTADAGPELAALVRAAGRVLRSYRHDSDERSTAGQAYVWGPAFAALTEEEARAITECGPRLRSVSLWNALEAEDDALAYPLLRSLGQRTPRVALEVRLDQHAGEEIEYPLSHLAGVVSRWLSFASVRFRSFY